MIKAKTQSEWLKSFDSQILKITKSNTIHVLIMSIEAIMKRQACIFAEISIYGGLCANFNYYFTFISREKQNQHSNESLKLPAMRTEFARKSVFFSIATLYSELHSSVQQKELGQNPRKFLIWVLWSGISMYLALFHLAVFFTVFSRNLYSPLSYIANMHTDAN